MMLQPAGVRALQAAGYFGVWTAASAWYIAFAELLNETWFRGRVSPSLLHMNLVAALNAGRTHC